MKYDKEFLRQLDLNHNKTIYARIIALNYNELPLESIEGRVSGGSLNIDGTSAIRRSCNLSIVTDKINISNYLWSLNTKFKLAIGLENLIDEQYPRIIWFEQGTYIINQFSTALGTGSFTINIGGKDKMCQLNGENGGKISSNVDFGKFEEIDANGNRTFFDHKIKDIIRDMVHAYGQEPYHNIIINDLDIVGMQLLEYRLKEPLYMLRYAEGDAQEYIYATTKGDIECIDEEGNRVTLDSLSSYDSRLTDTEKPTVFMLQKDNEFKADPEQTFCAAKMVYGDTVGYSQTDLTYAGDLIANPGDTVTSVLDKIKTMLGDYEYFYNIDGQFIFQKKKTYINTAWSPIITQSGEDYAVDPLVTQSSSTYNFMDNKLIINFNNNPNIANLKNDYSIWGERKSASGSSIPILMRYAIDKKPQSYMSIEVTNEALIDYNEIFNLKVRGQRSKFYYSGEYTYNQDDDKYTIAYNDEIAYQLQTIMDIEVQVETKGDKQFITFNSQQPIYLCDWRECIYQMALDYYKYNHLDDFHVKVQYHNPSFINGITGYEQYYIDLQGFWRDLYNLTTVYKKMTGYNQGEIYYKQTNEYLMDSADKSHGVVYTLQTKDKEYTPYYDEPYLDRAGYYVYQQGERVAVDEKLYGKTINYEEWTDIDETMSTSVAPVQQHIRNLYIIKSVGRKAELQSTLGTYYTITKAISNEGTIYSIVPVNTEIGLCEVKAAKEGYHIELISDLEQIEDDTELYTKTEYYCYTMDNDTKVQSYTKHFIKNTWDKCYADMTYYKDYGVFMRPVAKREDDTMAAGLLSSIDRAFSLYKSSNAQGIYYLSESDLDSILLALAQIEAKNYFIADKVTENNFVKSYNETLQGIATQLASYLELLGKNYNPTALLTKKELENNIMSLSYMIENNPIREFILPSKDETELYEFLGGAPAYNYNFVITDEDKEIIEEQIISILKKYTEVIEQFFGAIEGEDYIAFLRANAAQLLSYPDYMLFSAEEKTELRNYLRYDSVLQQKDDFTPMAFNDEKYYASIETLKSLSVQVINKLDEMRLYYAANSFEEVSYYEKTKVDTTASTPPAEDIFWLEPIELYVKDDSYLEETSWNRTVTEAPETLNFWFDFLDTTGDLQQFSVYNIGRRAEVKNDQAVKSIVYKNVPLTIFYDKDIGDKQTGYQYIYIEDIVAQEPLYYTIILDDNGMIKVKEGVEVAEGDLGISDVPLEDPYNKKLYTSWRFEMFYQDGIETSAWRGYDFSPMNQIFNISSQGKSAKNEIDTMLYQYAQCAEAVSITCIPVYYLEPNTQIYVSDLQTGIEGEYLINKITIPLTYNGTMNISATKANMRII